MKINTTTVGRAAAIALVTMLIIGCQTAPKTEAKKASLEQDAQSALKQMEAADPALADVVSRAYAYAIFPHVGKGGLIVGGGYGRGVVYEQGRQIGFADMTQASVGAQIGGQSFSELIVFENKEALDRFKNNQLTFSANASAVAVKKGAASSMKYENGVAVFVMPRAGLMAELSVGGQKFTFSPVEGSGQPSTRSAQGASATEGQSDTRTTETKTEIKTERRTTD
ncbi:MAG: hypothetical protein QOF78_192 [Phycisphaerales bacterium]|jgi:lipid-binding SYLF domain-containing protein|nr:hypothetical protein [Phycisphaerales bacterium]